MNENRKAAKICFGLSRKHDIASITAFLHMIGDPELVSTLAPRLSEEEIGEVVDLMTRLMRTHLSENEYHTLFLHKPEREAHQQTRCTP